MNRADISKVARLADEMAIRDLSARFADAATRGDYDAFRDCWDSNAEWIIGGPDNQPYEQRASGLNDIVGLYRSLWEEKEFFIQFAMQGPIEIDGDQASARCLCRETARRPGDAGYRTEGVWFDRLRRIGDRWVFTQRTYRYLWLDTTPFTGDGYPYDTAVWAVERVAGPHTEAVPVVAAKGVPYLRRANRLQRLNLYLPFTEANRDLIGTPVSELPPTRAGVPEALVHVHGGAWRDPQLGASSIEATVAQAFREPTGTLSAIAAIDYTVSAFPSHPSFPYDPELDEHSDPAREAVHPQHVSDVLHGLAKLRALGLADDSYLLSGHSCGACIAAQAVFGGPGKFGLDVADAPRPAAFLGLNGLYDLPALVDGLGASHERVRADYEMLLSNAFGADTEQWTAASPALFSAAELGARVTAGTAPKLVLLDQSPDDQLVPMNQKERFGRRLGNVDDLRVVDGHRCTSRHAEPWQQGQMIWQTVLDVLNELRSNR